jgi:hypothetical protein
MLLVLILTITQIVYISKNFYLINLFINMKIFLDTIETTPPISITFDGFTLESVRLHKNLSDNNYI